MIFVVAALAHRLSAASFKGERSGIEKDQVHFGKKIAPALEKRFLNEVLMAARELFALRLDGLSQKTHCPVKMMKLELFGSRDEVIFAPTLGRPIAAAGEQPM